MLTLGALAGLLAIASARPVLNASDPISVDDGYLKYPRIIPVKEVGCWYTILRPEEAEVAKHKFEKWSRFHHIRSASYNGEVFGHTAVWICNCKQFVSDHVVAAELDEAQKLITLRCGANVTGWVWSSKWQKSYNFGSSSTFYEHMHSVPIGGIPHHIPKCPKLCVRDINQPGGPHHGPFRNPKYPPRSGSLEDGPDDVVPDKKKPHGKKPDDGKPGDGDPDDGGPDDKDPGDKDPDNTNPDGNRPVHGDPDDRDPGDKDPDDKDPDNTNPDGNRPVHGDPDDRDPGDKDPDDKDPDNTNPDGNRPVHGDPDDRDPGDKEPDDDQDPDSDKE